MLFILIYWWNLGETNNIYDIDIYNKNNKQANKQTTKQFHLTCTTPYLQNKFIYLVHSLSQHKLTLYFFTNYKIFLINSSNAYRTHQHTVYTSMVLYSNVFCWYLLKYRNCINTTHFQYILIKYYKFILPLRLNKKKKSIKQNDRKNKLLRKLYSNFYYFVFDPYLFQTLNCHVKK